jgi:hypothetical protein
MMKWALEEYSNPNYGDHSGIDKPIENNEVRRLRYWYIVAKIRIHLRLMVGENLPLGLED